MTCPEDCGGELVLRRSRYGLFYGCENYPDCPGSHGAHPDGRPLGIPATKETKDARIRAHAAFDRLWKRSERHNRKRARRRYYGKLSRYLGIAVEDCHIGRFDSETCDRVIEFSDGYCSK